MGDPLDEVFPTLDLPPTPRPHHRRARWMALGVVVLAFVTAFVGVAAIRTNALGAGHLYDRAVAKLDRFLAGPVPDRSAPATVDVPQASVAAKDLDPDEIDPSAEPSASATALPSVGSLPTPVSTPTATPVPTPARVAVAWKDDR